MTSFTNRTSARIPHIKPLLSPNTTPTKTGLRLIRTEKRSSDSVKMRRQLGASALVAPIIPLGLQRVEPLVLTEATKFSTGPHDRQITSLVPHRSQVGRRRYGCGLQ